MKVTDRHKRYFRMALWVGSLAWAFFFFVYSLIMMPAFMEIIESAYEGGFPVWSFGIFYVMAIITAVVIFWWFFLHFWKRK